MDISLIVVIGESSDRAPIEYALKAHELPGDVVIVEAGELAGLARGSAEVVLLHAALPLNQVLAEAKRVLLPDGYVLFNAPDAEHLEAEIDRHGFVKVVSMHTDISDAMYGFAVNMTMFRRLDDDIAVARALARHERIALECSGGKDSLATLMLLKPYWDRLTVYWTNTGDPVPEVVEVIDRVRAIVPHFVEIQGRVQEQIIQWGLPSDLVPTTSTPFGHLAGIGTTPMQDRFTCCFASLMGPMQERVLSDGNTLIIRGQKLADKLKSPLRSGAAVDGIEYLFPVETWTDDEIFAYLDSLNMVPDFYRQLAQSPDCLTCSAYWSEGRAAWLKEKHPDAYGLYQAKLELIKDAVMPMISAFNHEVQ